MTGSFDPGPENFHTLLGILLAIIAITQILLLLQ